MKDSNFAPVPVKYCKHPEGARECEAHSNIRTFIFQVRLAAVPTVVIVMVAAVPVALLVSAYTEKKNVKISLEKFQKSLHFIS